MAKLTKFESLLREFEAPQMPKKHIEKLCEYLRNDNVYHPLFESYVSKRLQDNVHPERLLNMAYNLERDDRVAYLSKTINRQVADSMYLKKESFDQFYFMNRHDTRVDNHILVGFLDYFNDYFNDSFEILDTIAPHIGVDKLTLILRMMENDDFGRIRNMRLMNKLPVEDQYLLMVRALESHNPHFINLIDWAKTEVLTHLSELIIRDGDKDQFASALRNTLIPITELENNFTLTQLLEIHSDEMPGTLARLYYRAEQEGRWDYLLLLGVHKNKKELLRSIVKSKDQDLIDKFFSLYKNSPEVKHLVPFL